MDAGQQGSQHWLGSLMWVGLAARFGGARLALGPPSAAVTAAPLASISAQGGAQAGKRPSGKGKVAEEQQQQPMPNSEEEDEEMMREAIEEVLFKHLGGKGAAAALDARAKRKAKPGAGEGVEEESSSMTEDVAEEPTSRSRYGVITGTTSDTTINRRIASGRKSLGSEWYLDRCITCSACSKPIGTRPQAKRGVRCTGCMSWFHDSCAPGGMLPAEKKAREANPLISDFFHCAECREVHASMAAETRNRCGMQLPGGRTFLMLDLHSLRQQLAKHAEAVASGKAAQAGSGGSSSSKAWSSTSAEAGGSGGTQDSTAAAPSEFQPLPKHKLKRLNDSGLGSMYEKQAGWQGTGQEQGPEGGAAGATAAETAGALALSDPREGLRELRVVARIFRTVDPDEATEDVLEDGYAAVLRHNGIPVAAASFHVFGPDHARIQNLVTLPTVRRMGHATSLMDAMEAAVASAGVPRMVVVLRAHLPEDCEGAEPWLSRRMKLKPLEDLEVLANWKSQFKPYYTTELIGKRARVLMKQLPVAWRPAQQQAKGG